MKFYNLPSGALMPALGLGTWKSDVGEVGAAVQSALAMGYRHLDCAFIYGNEAEIGSALQNVFQEGDIERKDVFLTSKLWNTEHAPKDVEPALRNTLKDLQVDALDLYLMHWPVALSKESDGVEGAKMLSLEEMPLEDTWRAMEECVDKGLTKDIGVSNFSKKKLQTLLKTARIKPAVNQVEMHPYLQLQELKEFCDSEGIHLTAYSPLGSKDRPDFLKTKGEVPILEDAVIAEIAKKHEATAAQVLLAWAITRGSVIPKSTSQVRQAENLASIDISLDEEDLQRIASLEKGSRYVDGSFWCGPNSPYTLENLWDDEAVVESEL